MRIAEHKRCDELCVDKAIQEYKWENFTVEVLEECETLEQLDEREKFWIAELNCMSPNGYNYTTGGSGGSFHTPETKAKISAKLIGHEVSDKTRTKIGMANTGRKHTPGQFAKLLTNRSRKSPYKNLTNAILERLLSYEELAKFLELSTVSITRKMNCKQSFTENDVAKLVEIFGLPAEYLMERTEI